MYVLMIDESLNLVGGTYLLTAGKVIKRQCGIPTNPLWKQRNRFTSEDAEVR